MNVYEGSLVATGLKVGIVVSRFNSLVTEQLLSGALDALRRHGVKDGDVDVFRCPGTFELPPVVRRAARSGRYDAVVALGFKPDLRDYGIGAQILRDLGIGKMRLLTNNPKKIVGLEGYGLEVVERVPIEMVPTSRNRAYLATKRDKLGHLLTLPAAAPKRERARASRAKGRKR